MSTTEACQNQDVKPESFRLSVWAARTSYTESAVKVFGFALAALAVVCVSQEVALWATLHALNERQPYFVATDSSTGASYAIRPEAFAFRATDPLLKDYLRKFALKHWERDPATIGSAYDDSTWYMDQKLTNGPIVTAELKEIKQFVSGQGEPIHVEVERSEILIEGAENGCHDQLNSPSCVATVPMTLTVRNKVDGSPVATHRVLAKLYFVIHQKVTEEMMAHDNAIGLAIKDIAVGVMHE